MRSRLGSHKDPAKGLVRTKLQGQAGSNKEFLRRASSETTSKRCCTTDWLGLLLKRRHLVLHTVVVLATQRNKWKVNPVTCPLGCHCPWTGRCCSRPQIIRNMDLSCHGKAVPTRNSTHYHFPPQTGLSLGPAAPGALRKAYCPSLASLIASQATSHPWPIHVVDGSCVVPCID